MFGDNCSEYDSSVLSHIEVVNIAYLLNHLQDTAGVTTLEQLLLTQTFGNELPANGMLRHNSG